MRKAAISISLAICLSLPTFFYLKTSLDFSDLSTSELQEMSFAYEEIKKCYEEMRKQNTTLLAISSCEWEDLKKSAHYPAKDIYDPETCSQYYYHSHRRDEHGHFHLFQRANGFPIEIQKDAQKGHVHLIAITLDKEGLPKNIFTTNQWLTGELWYSAENLLKILPCFYIKHEQPSALTNRWLNAMLTLFRPQIKELIRKKQIVLQKRGLPIEQVLQDRSIEVLTEKKISLLKQHKAIQEALRKRN